VPYREYLGADFAALFGLAQGTISTLPYLQQITAQRALSQGFQPRNGFGGFYIAIPEQGLHNRMSANLQAQLRRAGFVRASVNGVVVWGYSPIPMRMDQETRIQEIASGMPGRKAQVALRARAMGAIINWYGSPPGAAVFDGKVNNGIANVGGELPPTLRRELENAGYVKQPYSAGQFVWVSSEGWTPH